MRTHIPPESAPSRPLPRRGADRVVLDILQLRDETWERPPQLSSAIAHMMRALEADDEQALDCALRELAVAAMATLTRIRAAWPA